MNILITMTSLKFCGDYTTLLVITLISLILYTILKKKKIIITNNLIILTMFSITYFTITSYYLQDSTKIAVYSIIAYLIGLMLISTGKNSEKDIIKCVYAIGMGFFIHAMLNYITNLDTQTRNTIDFWTQTTKSATLQATMLTIIMGTTFYTFFCINKLWKKVILIAFIFLAISYDMILATRTLIVIFIVSFIVCTLYYWYINRKKEYIYDLIKKVSITILILSILYQINFIGIKENFEESIFISRINRKDTIKADKSRLETQLLAIPYMLQYPMGGNTQEVGNLKYVHNMWFDVAKQAGIIPFILLILFFIINLRNLIKVIKNKNIDSKFKIFLIGIYIAVILNFAVEPIMQGEELFFIMFCVIMGMIDGKEKVIKFSHYK